MAIRFKLKLRSEDLGIFDPDEVEIEHAMMLEDKTGLSIGDLANGLSRLSARSLQALVWLQRIRAGKYDADLHEKFKFGELKTEDVSDEDPTEAAPAADGKTPSAASGTSTSDS